MSTSARRFDNDNARAAIDAIWAPAKAPSSAVVLEEAVATLIQNRLSWNTATTPSARHTSVHDS